MLCFCSRFTFPCYLFNEGCYTTSNRPATVFQRQLEPTATSTQAICLQVQVLTRLDDVYQLKRLGISSLNLYIEKSLSWLGRQLGTTKCSSYYSKVMYTRMMLKCLCWIFSPRLPQESQNFTFFFYFFSHTFIDTYNIHLYYSLIYLFINCTTIIASWFSNTVFNQ